VRAQAVLSRDLREIRERQQELDNPSTQIPEEQSLPSPVDLDQTMALDEKDLAHDSPDLILHDAAAEGGESDEQLDAIGTNLKVEDTHEPEAATLETLPSPQSLQNPIQDAQAAKDKSLNDDLDMLFSQHGETAGPGIDTTGAAPSAASEALVTGGLQSMNFDSIFGTEGNGESNDINFDDLDFSGDGTVNHNNANLDFGGNDGDMDLSSFGEHAVATSANNDDVSAMLQMDNFAHSGGDNDFSMLDLSNNSAQSNNNQAPTQPQDDFGMAGGDLDVALGIGNNESNFDDLLDGIDFGEDADNGAGGDLMEHGEFDDAFFGISGE
jgi:hypothetical protein